MRRDIDRLAIATKDYDSKRSTSIHTNFVFDLVSALEISPLIISLGETPLHMTTEKGNVERVPTFLAGRLKSRISERSILRDTVRVLESWQMLRLATQNLRGMPMVHWFEHFGLVHTLLRFMFPKTKSCITLFSYLRRYAFYNALLRLSLRGFDRIVTTTEEFRLNLISFGIPPEKVVSIPLGVDLTYFHPPTDKNMEKAKLGLATEDFVVSWFAQITPSTDQDYDQMLEIASRVHASDRRLRFLFCFKNPTSNAKRVLVPGVRILGRVDVRSILWASDLLVLPFTDTAAFAVQPLTAIEALACAVPVMVLRNRALEELVSDGINGIVASDSGELMDSLLRLASDPDLLKLMGKNARQAAQEKFDIKKVAETYIKVWGEVLQA